MAHSHRQLPDAISGPPQQEHDFRLGIILRVPVSEGKDDIAVSGAESAGAVGQIHAHQNSNHRSQHQTAELSDKRLPISRLGEEARTDNEVDVVFEQMVHQAADFGRTVLSVSVHLDGQVVPVQCRIAVARLHRAADAEVKWQAHDRNAGGNLPNRVVGRAVVDHEHVKFGQRPAQPQDDFANRGGFVKDGNDYQAAFCRGSVDGLAVKLRHIWVAAVLSVLDGRLRIQRSRRHATVTK